MANEEHLAILRKGPGEWYAWRDEHTGVRPDLSGAELRKADLFGANLSSANLTRANLSRANLFGADLREANLLDADLSDADLSGDNVSGANLSGANLSGANLSGANLSGANLSGADLSKANVFGANFSEANLLGANLSGADLREADLDEADLREADLREADLRYSNLSGANLRDGNLSGANLSRANLFLTVFADVDLSEVKGLESVEHMGPSSIGIDTIYKSRGNIPEVFLRGSGVPEPFIVQMKALVAAMEPIQFYSCFISHSTADQAFAERLCADLQAKAVRTWFAPHDIKAGRKLHEQIDEAIRKHDKLLLVLSPSSMASEWVGTEIAKAREREVKEGRRMLFPIALVPFNEIRSWKLFDADIGKDSAREIRKYFIPDFSNWKDHDSYQAAFNGLLRDLKAEAEARAR